ncbi:hypothetical protein F5148DRAFT_1225595 [Russula earlei]|uniref:Uncharacterized protein n=1 Tax=Russula earlei TaxID=71964 RepID=A0ACC0U2G9_9AGAM|nr:hypothetical protein F5148DRAFT_1225595 [Russula earlei]
MRDAEKGNGEEYDDDAGPLFSMYWKMAAEEDVKMVERWVGDADSILIFTGLFSAAVSALLAVTTLDLLPSPQDTSNFYLRNITQLLSERNATTLSDIPGPPGFFIPWDVTVVNFFWFSSLLMSITCAVMATVVQQWARLYIRYSQPPQRGPRTRARIRAMFYRSVDKLFIKNLGAFLPSYLHLSLIFFLVGLLVYLYTRDKIIFGFVSSLLLVSMGVYLFFTFLPLFQHNSLLYTPLSTLPHTLFALLVGIVLMLIGRRFRCPDWIISDWAFEDVGKKADKFAAKRSETFDDHVLTWSLNSLGDDDEVEKFLQAVPEFFRHTSKTLSSLTDRMRAKFRQIIHGFLDRTFRSSSITEDDIRSRVLICIDASNAALGPNEFLGIFNSILTDPDLQYVWNGIVSKAQNNGDRISIAILKNFGGGAFTTPPQGVGISSGYQAWVPSVSN